jgi:hypothetical protein
MGFFSRHEFDLLALLVCDECERVLTIDGRLTATSLREIPPAELQPHFRPRDELAKPATEAGWRGRIAPVYGQSHWLCPRCATDGGGDSARWRLVPKVAR